MDEVNFRIAREERLRRGEVNPGDLSSRLLRELEEFTNLTPLPPAIEEKVQLIIGQIYFWECRGTAEEASLRDSAAEYGVLDYVVQNWDSGGGDGDSGEDTSDESISRADFLQLIEDMNLIAGIDWRIAKVDGKPEVLLSETGMAKFAAYLDEHPGLGGYEAGDILREIIRRHLDDENQQDGLVTFYEDAELIALAIMREIATETHDGEDHTEQACEIFEPYLDGGGPEREVGLIMALGRHGAAAWQSSLQGRLGRWPSREEMLADIDGMELHSLAPDQAGSEDVIRRDHDFPDPELSDEDLLNRNEIPISTTRGFSCLHTAPGCRTDAPQMRPPHPIGQSSGVSGMRCTADGISPHARARKRLRLSRLPQAGRS